MHRPHPFLKARSIQWRHWDGWLKTMILDCTLIKKLPYLKVVLVCCDEASFSRWWGSSHSNYWSNISFVVAGGLGIVQIHQNILDVGQCIGILEVSLVCPFWINTFAPWRPWIARRNNLAIVVSTRRATTLKRFHLSVSQYWRPPCLASRFW